MPIQLHVFPVPEGNDGVCAVCGEPGEHHHRDVDFGLLPDREQHQGLVCEECYPHARTAELELRAASYFDEVERSYTEEEQ